MLGNCILQRSTRFSVLGQLMVSQVAAIEGYRYITPVKRKDSLQRLSLMTILNFDGPGVP